jgi:hypothetical protein
MYRVAIKNSNTKKRIEIYMKNIHHGEFISFFITEIGIRLPDRARFYLWLSDRTPTEVTIRGVLGVSI